MKSYVRPAERARPGRIAAWVVVALFHMAAFWLLRGSAAIVKAPDPAMEVVFIQPLPSPPRRARPSPQLSGATRDAMPTPRTPSKAPMVAARVPTPVSTTLLVVTDDAWELARPQVAAGRSPGPNLFQDRPNPLAASAPDRFRMRPQLSPADIVRGASRILGFWPPGYTDDPCRGIKRSIEILSQSTAHRSRQRLVEALQIKSQHCS